MVAINRLVSVLSLCLGTNAAFTLYNATELENKNVGDSCVKALAANIACPKHIRSFVAPSVHGSLKNITLTNEICTGTCSASLRSWFNNVVSACANDDFGDGVPQRLGGYIWAGWNETCIKDPRSKKYCNDIIAEFPTPTKGEDLSRDQLCSVCYGRKLATMQSSSYSVYNKYYQARLERVYKTCGGSGPTEIPPPVKVEEKPEEFCLNDKWYTTKEGDTCDSIAKANPGVAGVYLYMGNQELIADCRRIRAGIKLCLPTACPTYVIQPKDTCYSIERAQKLRLDDVEYFNSWINIDCTNLHKATDFYGKSICIGAFGSKYPGSWVREEPADVADPAMRLKHSSANGPVPKPMAAEEL
ncbi:hypothetical protein NW760_013789 [Fusarium oxysporum]|nr:hypothetical protein NW769_013666 [Fusarium oxysporum]KAJ4216625.1 hypothetical protein NW760_013789 [Fusarium oxysporum]